MKKTVTLAELLTASGFTAGQHNDPETTEFYTRSFEKEVETCWHGKLTSSLTVNITIAPKGGWCMASFNKGFRTPTKQRPTMPTPQREPTTPSPPPFGMRDLKSKEDRTMWREGSIKIENNWYKFWVKQYETGSRFGIDGGRVSKLEIKRNGETVANYDRGWDIRPVDTDTEKALAILLYDYN